MSEFDGSDQPKIPTQPSQLTLPPEVYPSPPDAPIVPTWLYVVFGIILVVVIALVLIVGVILIRSIPADSTVTPVTTTPSLFQAVLSAAPPLTSASEAVTISGSNWPAGDSLSAFLRDPNTPADPILPIGSAQADQTGVFSLTFNYPIDPRWSKLSQVDVIVQSANTGAYQVTPLRLRAAATTTPAVLTATPPPPVTDTPTPTPTNSPTPVVITDWRGEYFSNQVLSGGPVLVRNDIAVNFNWGSGAPADGLPADNFSARWTRSLVFQARLYRVTVKADDGVRVWIDNVLLIDEWHIATGINYTHDINMTGGTHAVKIEYYEQNGNAAIQFAIAPITVYTDWKGEYFSNPFLSGTPVVIRNDIAVDFDWGFTSPGQGIPADKFSARWTRLVNLPGGMQRFTLRADDGVRFYIDGLLMIDEWHDGSSKTYTRDVNLGAGLHELKVEYYENTGQANISLTHQAVGDIIHWYGEYFASDDWSEPPVFIRDDDVLNFDWSDGSPDPLVPSDHFSVRWTRALTLTSGVYRFDLTADDGVRFLVDNVPVIDELHVSNAQTYSTQLTLGQGVHHFEIRYVEYTGLARFALTMVNLSATPTPTPTLTPTLTPTPTPTPTPTTTATPTPTATATGTTTATPTITPTASPTPTVTASATLTSTIGSTAVVTSTVSQ